MAKDKSEKETEVRNYKEEAEKLAQFMAQEAWAAVISSNLEECEKHYLAAHEARVTLLNDYKPFKPYYETAMNEFLLADAKLKEFKAKAGIQSDLDISLDDNKSEVNSDERLSSDENSQLSELESSVSSRKSGTPPPLQPSPTKYEVMPNMKDAQTPGENFEEEVDITKKQSSTVQPTVPQPETSKPEKYKPGLLNKIMNGIRDLFKGDHAHKNTTGGSMRTIIDRTKGNHSVEEMKTNIEANKQAKWVETKPSIDKGPLTASKIEKQLPSANWFKDDEKQEDTRPTLGGHRRP